MLHHCYTTISGISLAFLRHTAGILSRGGGSRSSKNTAGLKNCLKIAVLAAFAKRFLAVTTVTLLLLPRLYSCTVLGLAVVTLVFFFGLLSQHCYKLSQHCYNHCYTYCYTSIPFIINKIKKNVTATA